MYCGNSCILYRSYSTRTISCYLTKGELGLFPMAFAIGEKVIGSGDVFVIAEIGQNHQGDIEIAKAMIKKAKECGADCVKFQKSWLPEKFTKAALERAYTSVNSWGRTYGEHKAHLEFDLEQYLELQRFSNNIGILFTASAMDEVSLNQLYELKVPFIKVGSGDGNNFQMIAKASQHPTPLVVSTGMQKESTVRNVVRIVQDTGKHNFCLMHCVSSYPTKPEHANLRLLEVYRQWFPDVCFGYSGHEQGVWISLAATLLGAQVIERHFTLGKHQKGTDHALSLEPTEFELLIKSIRQIERIVKATPMTDNSDQSVLSILSQFPNFQKDDSDAVLLALKPIATKKVLNCEMDCFNKLSKSLVFTRDLSVGMQICETHICAKVSEPRGIPADRLYDILGLHVIKDVQKDNLVSFDYLKEFS